MVNLTVNGKARTYDGDPDMPLLWYLRDDLRLTGTRFGKAFLAVVSLHKMRAHFGTDSGRQAEVLGIADQIFAHTRDCHGGDAVAIAGIDNFAKIADGLMLMHAANVDLHRHGRGIQTKGIIDIDRD